MLLDDESGGGGVEHGVARLNSGLVLLVIRRQLLDQISFVANTSVDFKVVEYEWLGVGRAVVDPVVAREVEVLSSPKEMGPFNSVLLRYLFPITPIFHTVQSVAAVVLLVDREKESIRSRKWKSLRFLARVIRDKSSWTLASDGISNFSVILSIGTALR